MRLQRRLYGSYNVTFLNKICNQKRVPFFAKTFKRTKITSVNVLCLEVIPILQINQSFHCGFILQDLHPKAMGKVAAGG